MLTCIRFSLNGDPATHNIDSETIMCSFQASGPEGSVGASRATLIYVRRIGHTMARQSQYVVDVMRRDSQEVSDDKTGDDPTDALRAIDRLVEAGFTTFQLGNALGGGRDLAEKRIGAYLRSVSMVAG